MSRHEWTPERVAELRSLTMAGHTAERIAELLGVGRMAVSGARFRYKIERPEGPVKIRFMPEDFAEVGPTITIREAANHYKAARQTVRGWYKELDLRPAIWKPPVGFTQSYRAPRRTGQSAYLRFNIPERSSSQASSAQLFLQRYGPVIRARTVDRLAPEGQWIVHGRRMAETDMLASAARKGWKPQAMAA